MFNRSWYKNTWLGKKLGFKVDWNKENLVSKDSGKEYVKVFHSLEDGVCIGFVSSIRYSLSQDGSIIASTSSFKVHEYVDYIKMSDYNIEYDTTKIKANEKLKTLKDLDDDYKTLSIYLGYSNKYVDYNVNEEFLLKTRAFNVTVATSCKNDHYYLDIKYKSEWKNNVEALAKVYIKNDKS